jgi:hypothetical protein
MDLDGDTELGGKREHQQINALGWMSYSCMESSHCMRLLSTFIFGDCQGSYRLSSQGLWRISYYMPTAGSEQILTHQNIPYISAKPNPILLPEVRVVLFRYGQKAKILSNTTAHFPTHTTLIQPTWSSTFFPPPRQSVIVSLLAQGQLQRGSPSPRTAVKPVTWPQDLSRASGYLCKDPNLI